jgi:Predicted signal transduction protein
MHSILFVDDEKAILKSLERLFINDDFKLYFAQDGKTALKIMYEHNIEMVVSDMRMPKMSGHKLLREIQLLYPDTIRIILSGYSDEQEIYKAVLDGSAKIYLLKPWEPLHLLDVIRHMFKFKDMLASKNILDVIDKIDQLPVVTNIYNRICTLIEKEASIPEVAAVIEEDATVSAKILQLINSAYYNKKIGSVKQAVIYFGLNVVKIMVLSTSIFNYVDANSSPYFNNLFSQQSMLTNKILEVIYKAAYKKKLPENYMTAGLLHDIGLVVMQQQFPDKYFSAFKQSSPETSFYEAEHEMFGVTHQEIGGYLLEWWGIPYPIVESCLLHHDPLSSSINRGLVYAVHLADYYAWNYLGQKDLVKLDDRVFQAMGIEQVDCDNLVNESLENWQQEIQ